MLSPPDIPGKTWYHLCEMMIEHGSYHLKTFQESSSVMNQGFQIQFADRKNKSGTASHLSFFPSIDLFSILHLS